MADPVSQAWPKLERAARKRKIFLFLDYDGTLVPITRKPHLAKLSLPRKELLQEMVNTKGLKIAIVSGRSLAELKSQVGVEGIVYAGNHGLELEGPKINFVHPQALALKQFLKKLADLCEQKLSSFPGIWVENKVYTLSIHYRELPPKDVVRAKESFLELLKPYLESSRLTLTEGKKVWEVRPSTQWDKGRIVLWLLAREMAHASKKVFPIYIGDDQTDEDAFKALKRRGLGLKVTEEPSGSTNASYFLQSPEEVFVFLRRLRDLKTGRSKPNGRA